MAVGSVKKGFSVASGSLPLVGALFVFGFVWNVVNLFFTAQFQAQNEAPQASLPMIFIGIAFVLLSIFVQAGSLGYVRDRLKTGSADFGGFLAAGRQFYVRLLLLGLLMAAIVGVFVLVAAFGIAATGQQANAAGIAVAVLVALIGIYVMILLFLAPYAAVAGDERVIQSLKSSISIVKKNFFAALGLALLLVVIGFAFGLLLGAVYALLSTAMPGTVSQVVFAALSSFVNAYLGLVVSGAFMNFYFLKSGNTGGAA